MKDLKYILIIFAISIASLVIIQKMSVENEKARKEYILRNNTLQKISDKQSRKLIADSLTKREMKKHIDSLEIDLKTKPKIVIQPEIRFRDEEKKPDTVFIDKDNVRIVDYYPNKVEPFVKYSFRDSIGKFSFYPIKIAIVVSERKDGIWQVDTKMPEYVEVTDIKAVALPIKVEKSYKQPFYLGGGVMFNKDGNAYYEAVGGFKIGNILTLGSFTTTNEKGVKILYNF